MAARIFLLLMGWSCMQVDARTSNGSTALHSAAANGQMQIVEQLLQQNCNVNIRALTGATALYGAATAGHLEVAKRLIEHGGDLTIATTAGSIPLHSAASSGHIEVVKLLLNAGSKKALIDAQVRNIMHVSNECHEFFCLIVC